jgi:hypothetical protein
MLKTVRQKPWQKTQLWGLYKTQDGSPGEEELVEEGNVRSHVWGIWESSSHGFYGPQ